MSAADPGRTRLGTLLRCHRIAAGLTQKKLAERSGLSVRAISNIERGRTARPYSSSIQLLANALKLPDRVLDELASTICGAEDRDLRGTAGRLPDLAARVAPPVVPRQLPSAVAYFTGRAGELAALTGLLNGPASTTGRHSAVVISAIGGTAGVGKTALAVHWAHRASEWFPDGQLYVNLRGYDPGQPVSAAEALAGFLRALGVPGQAIPADQDERAALYRSLLSERRVLVVLDNAGNVNRSGRCCPAARVAWRW